MAHSTLYPPNFNKLGDGVIGDVRLRRRPSYDVIAAGINAIPVEKGNLVQPNPTLLAPSSKTQAQLPSILKSNAKSLGSTDTVSRTPIDDPSIELRRRRHRVNTARYRKKQSERMLKLEDDIRQLNSEIRNLELQRIVSAGIPARKTLWSTAADYFRVFHYGYKAPRDGLDLEGSNGQTARSVNAQRKFLEDAMPRDAADSVEMLLNHWQILSFYFPMIEMKLVQLEKRAEHTAFAVAKMKATITEHTLHHAFPHLVNRCTWSPLALKLLNTHIIISESVHFEWDNDRGCITKIRHSSDLLTPLLQLLGNLEDVALVFDKARVSPVGQVH